MGFLSNIFKEKKKNRSRNASEHDHLHSHHDPTSARIELPEAISQEREVAAAPRAPSPVKEAIPHVEHSKEFPQHTIEQLARPQPAVALPQQPEPQAPQHSHPPQPQAQQRPLTGLKPAYCYTGGEFSETISHEEAMLAKQYNFAATDDRAHADVTPSATHRAVTSSAEGWSNNTGSATARNLEFDSLFTQFIHETNGK